MNKKGYLNSFIFGIIGLFVLILILVVLLPVNYGTMDVNESVSVLNESQSRILEVFSNASISARSQEGPVGVIMGVLYKFFDFIVYSGFEVAKLGVQVGDKYLSINGIWFLIVLILLSLGLPIIIGLIKIIVIFGILIGEIISWRRERKEIKRLKKEKEK